jgi:hypothetical protein
MLGISFIREVIQSVFKAPLAVPANPRNKSDDEQYVLRSAASIGDRRSAECLFQQRGGVDGNQTGSISTNGSEVHSWLETGLKSAS